MQVVSVFVSEGSTAPDGLPEDSPTPRLVKPRVLAELAGADVSLVSLLRAAVELQTPGQVCALLHPFSLYQHTG